MSSNSKSSIVDALLKGKHPLAQEMKRYIATPWCKCQDEVYKDCLQCQPAKKTKTQQGPQAHGGDLFQHSQWCALYLTNWYLDATTEYKVLHRLLKDIIHSSFLKKITGTKENALEFVQVCGFFHDCCKGGDQIYDMYQPNKYGKGTNDSIHPDICHLQIISPKNSYHGLLGLALNEILNNYKDSQVARFILSLVAATHWDFGKLNYDKKFSIQDYIKFINLKKVQIATEMKLPKTSLVDDGNVLVKLCMVVSCADVAATYNKEINSTYVNGVAIAPLTHLSDGGAWIKFAFNKNHVAIIKNVLKALRGKSKTVGKNKTVGKKNHKRKTRKI